MDKQIKIEMVCTRTPKWYEVLWQKMTGTYTGHKAGDKVAVKEAGDE